MSLPTNKNSLKDLQTDDTELEELEAEMQGAETDKEAVETQDSHETDDIASEFLDAEETEEEETETEDKAETQPEKPKQPEIDYKERYAESTREAQILHSRNQDYNKAVDEALQIAEPTDAELKLAYPDVEIDTLSNLEKHLLKENFINKRRFEIISRPAIDSKKLDEWQGKVQEFLDVAETAQSFPELVGREQAFRTFAAKPTHRGTDLEVLAKAFTLDLSKEPQNLRRNGNLFESPTAGEMKKNKELSAEQEGLLRKQHPKLWMDRLKPWYGQKRA